MDWRDRREWVRRHLLLVGFVFWAELVAIDVLSGAARAWSLLYAGHQTAAFWTVVHLATPWAIQIGFFYGLYMVIDKVAVPFLRRRHPDIDWPEVGWRWPWQEREDDS